MPIITVTRILSNQDFRGYKRMLHIALRHLQGGEAIICFNRKHTRARVIDAEGGIYFMPNPPIGEIFDVSIVTAWIDAGLGVTLRMPSSTTQHNTRRKRAA